MLLRNLELEGNENDLVNGSRGILVGWKPREQVLDECFQLQQECVATLRKGYETNEERKIRIRVEQKIDNLTCSTIEHIPIVKFMNNRRITCVPEKFSYEFLNVGECIRWQVGTTYPDFLNCDLIQTSTVVFGCLNCNRFSCSEVHTFAIIEPHTSYEVIC